MHFVEASSQAVTNDSNIFMCVFAVQPMLIRNRSLVTLPPLEQISSIYI
jgi:hypothetical protein